MLATQCRMARAALGLTVRELAERAGVSHDTIVRLEGGQELKESTVKKVRETFEAAGIEFTNGMEPGLKIKSPDGATLIAPARTGKRIG
jgi:transcriptional regulator with XRE-family HTH domain